MQTKVFEIWELNTLLWTKKNKQQWSYFVWCGKWKKIETSLRSWEPFRVKFFSSIWCKRSTLQFALWPFIYRSQKTSKRQAYFLASLIPARRSLSSAFSSYLPTTCIAGSGLPYSLTTARSWSVHFLSPLTLDLFLQASLGGTSTLVILRGACLLRSG